MNRVQPYSLLTDFDIELFKSGNHYKLYEKLGARKVEYQGQIGYYFAVYAPASNKVQLVGDFNYWSGDQFTLHVRYDGSGIWEGFVPGIPKGSLYKYKITNSDTGEVFEKADPFAFYAEHPPKTASILWDYPTSKKSYATIKSDHKSPMSIYEIHLASWKRPWGHKAYLDYDELGDQLIPHLQELKFTHVEFMPVMEYPYDPSWGYQITSYFAPTSRMGDPQSFRKLVDRLHEAGIGVILDWVPSHFPEDAHGLAKFDGSHVYEHPDKKRGYHPDWKSLIFNYGRPEVKSFLISNALFWLDIYGVDGLRVDAVASMLYLDYSREEGEWDPNVHGGNENLEAIAFMKDLNKACYEHFPHIQMIAEESTSFNGVTKPVHEGGLGFGYKWMMGWMNDTLNYYKKDSIHRKFHQNEITFSMVYAYSENYVLPFSHDEVVHGKGSLLQRMPGDEWQKFANLRTLYGYMYAHPGAKLLFMGCEWGHSGEWDHSKQLEWSEIQYPFQSGIKSLISDLNHLYRTEKALYSLNYAQEGFEWVDYGDHEKSILIFLRKTEVGNEEILVVINNTPSAHKKYSVGVPKAGTWTCILNTDDLKYSGSGFAQKNEYETNKEGFHQRPYSIDIEIPPLSTCFFKLKL